MSHAGGKPQPVCVLAFACLAGGQELDALEGRLSPGPARAVATVVVDLQGVRSLDRAHVTALLRFRNRVCARGGDVALASLGRRVRLQAQRMQLHRIFEIFNSPQEATAV